MNKKNKVLIVITAILFLVFLEVTRLNYTIKAVKINKKINAKKKLIKDLETDILKEKIKLIQKSDLDTMKKIAEKQLGMKVSEKINYIKIEESVSK